MSVLHIASLMAIQLTRCAARVARALFACVLVYGVNWTAMTTCSAQELEDALSGEADFPSSRSLAEELPARIGMGSAQLAARRHQYGQWTRHGEPVPAAER